MLTTNDAEDKPEPFHVPLLAALAITVIYDESAPTAGDRRYRWRAQ